MPDRVVSEMAKTRRGGKVFIRLESELRLQNNGMRVLNAREAPRAVHFDADHLEGAGESCRPRR
jgi:DNA primase